MKPPTFFVLTAALLLPPSAWAATMSPSIGEQGQSLQISIYEPQIPWGSQIEVDMGVDIAQVEAANLGDGLLRAEIEIAPDAVTGYRDVTISDGTNVETFPALFRVIGVSGLWSSAGSNVVENPGFETGDMSGWIPTTWSVDTVLPHGGTYDAYDPGGSGGGGSCMRQNFSPPIDSNTITSFSFWLRQPDDAGIAQVIVFYQSGNNEIDVAFTNDDDSWTFENFTNLIHPNDLVTGLHVCGFGGGQGTPDDSWADDFTLEATGPTATQEMTWGQIKAMKR